ncbi:MAG TPA: hypothetical protein VJR46_04890 [Candidatus Dormibacteraeota bacterium]|nr:hypothetical protein [Candidatus Dormibacteraeota bacterium]
MRSPALDVLEPLSSRERRAVLRNAIRQLERADLYLAAVAVMELDDRDASRAIGRLRGEVDALRHHLIDVRSQT